MSETGTSSSKSLTPLSYLLLLVILAVVVFVRIRLLNVPLERDEGEFAYMGQLLLKGIPPFTHAYTMKLPGVSVAYALFMLLFGQTAAAIHLGLLLVNLFCILLVYLLAARLLDRDSARIACASYAVLSVSTGVYGLFAHATHFVVLFSLAGFLLLFRSLDSRRLSPIFFSGLCFGLAVTMKQHAALLIPFALLYYARRVKMPVPEKKGLCSAVTLFISGTALPYALIVLWVARAGSFAQFWFWTVDYARQYACGPSLIQGALEFGSEFYGTVSAQPFLWLMTVTGGAILCTRHGRRFDRLFLAGFLLFSFLAICPGLVFRKHYFVLLLPGAALLVGAAVQSACALLMPGPGKLRSFLPLLACAPLLLGIYHEKETFFTLSSQQVSRALYGANPFPEAPRVARYLKDHTTSQDRIAVLGSEPEIYFYSDRLSATGHIYMYGLMEPQPHAGRMQSQMIREIEQARPKFVVAVNEDASWLVGPWSRREVLSWSERYVRERYEVVGVIDIIDADTTRYAWDADAKVAAASTVSGSNLTVFRRRDGA